MSLSKKSACIRSVDRQYSVHPRLFVFFDKRTGTPRFQVAARPDGTLPGLFQCKAANFFEPCQDQVLAGITQNLSNKEIAAKLSISERTVKFHVQCPLTPVDESGRRPSVKPPKKRNRYEIPP